MYAFTLKKRQIPTPTKSKEKTVNTISSPRNLQCKNFRSNVLTPTEKIAVIKNKTADNNTF